MAIGPQSCPLQNATPPHGYAAAVACIQLCLLLPGASVLSSFPASCTSNSGEQRTEPVPEAALALRRGLLTHVLETTPHTALVASSAEEAGENTQRLQKQSRELLP